jgi:hypothetical protein
MAYQSVREEIDAMRRHLRWAVPLWLGMAIAFGGWRAAEGDSPGRVVASFAACVAVGVVVVPLVWVRYRGAPQGRREVAVSFKVLGLALAWSLVAGAVLLGAGLLLDAALTATVAGRP